MKFFLALLLATQGALAQTWDNDLTRPSLSNPLYITSTAHPNVSLGNSGAYGILCNGLFYTINGGDRDMEIRIPAKLDYPVSIRTTGSVHVIGMEIDLVVQSGCDVGDLPNNPTSSFPNANIKPRPPIGRAIAFEVKGVAWVEGLYAEINGHNADCITWSAPVGLFQEYYDNSSFYLVNSRCNRYDGHGSSEIGDSLHADIFQSQRGAPKNVYLENVVAVSGNEGWISNEGGWTPETYSARNYAYLEDTFWQVGPVSWGPMIAVNTPDAALTLENIWINAPGPAVWGNHSGSWPAGWRFVPWNAPNGDIPTHPEITYGDPPADYAPIASIGTNYVSPFDTPVYTDDCFCWCIGYRVSFDAPLACVEGQTCTETCEAQ